MKYERKNFKEKINANKIERLNICRKKRRKKKRKEKRRKDR